MTMDNNKKQYSCNLADPIGQSIFTYYLPNVSPGLDVTLNQVYDNSPESRNPVILTWTAMPLACARSSWRIQSHAENTAQAPSRKSPVACTN